MFLGSNIHVGRMALATGGNGNGSADYDSYNDDWSGTGFNSGPGDIKTYRWNNGNEGQIGNWIVQNGSIVLSAGSDPLRNQHPPLTGNFEITWNKANRTTPSSTLNFKFTESVGFSFGSDNSLRVYAGSYFVLGDIITWPVDLRIKRTSGTIEYYVNNILKYTYVSSITLTTAQLNQTKAGDGFGEFVLLGADGQPIPTGP
jgi:hypothetical protein